jgi:hypothetical protein
MDGEHYAYDSLRLCLRRIRTDGMGGYCCIMGGLNGVQETSETYNHYATEGAGRPLPSPWRYRIASSRMDTANLKPVLLPFHCCCHNMF